MLVAFLGVLRALRGEHLSMHELTSTLAEEVALFQHKNVEIFWASGGYGWSAGGGREPFAPGEVVFWWGAASGKRLPTPLGVASVGESCVGSDWSLKRPVSLLQRHGHCQQRGDDCGGDEQ